jgi:hypothetical protein
MKKEFFFMPAPWAMATYFHGFCWDFAYQNFSLKILATEILAKILSVLPTTHSLPVFSRSVRPMDSACLAVH